MPAGTGNQACPFHRSHRAFYAPDFVEKHTPERQLEYLQSKMKNGWRMKEIDEMDMLGFLRLRAWDAQREQEKKKPRQSFIDEVWPGVKP